MEGQGGGVRAGEGEAGTRRGRGPPIPGPNHWSDQYLRTLADLPTSEFE
jgi:hypothetical protein